MNFVCSICGQSFSRKDNLKRHDLEVHNQSGVRNCLTDSSAASGFSVQSEFQIAKPVDEHTPHNESDSVMTSPNRTESANPVILHHPFSMVLAGPSGCGKSSLVAKLIGSSKKLIYPPPKRLLWFYKIWQPLYNTLRYTTPSIEFYKGLPRTDQLTSDATVPRLFVIDDFMAEGTENKGICSMFTEGSHHYNYSVCFLLQNIFYGGKLNRTISLNTHYMILFKNPRDKLQIVTLARQMYPYQPQKLLDLYEEATTKPFGYLLVDLKQSTPEGHRLVRNALDCSIVLPGVEVISEGSPKIYSQPVTMEVPQTSFCNMCGIVFIGANYLQEHQCQTVVGDESVWVEITKDIKNNLPDDARTKDVLKWLKRQYTATLVKMYELSKSEYHRQLMNTFLQKVKFTNPEEAAKKTVQDNHGLLVAIIRDFNERNMDDTDDSEVENNQSDEEEIDIIN